MEMLDTTARRSGDVNVYPNGCSRCGATDELVARFAACAAKATWKSKVNRSDIVAEDDIAVWTVRLCQRCLTSAYKDGLREDIKTSIKFLCFLVIISPGGYLLWTDYREAAVSDGISTRLALLPDADQFTSLLIFNLPIIATA